MTYNRGDGVPFPGTNLSPSGSGDNARFTPDAGPSEIKDSKGGPATFHGSSDKGFLSDSGYRPSGEIRTEGGMSVKDLEPNRGI